MFVDISEILQGKEGEVTIHGWLHHKRSSGGIQFLIIRDGTGYIQATLRKEKIDEKTFKEIEKLPVESVVEITGKAKKESRAPEGYEVQIEKIKVSFKAEEEFPISKKYHGPEFLLDYRHLWLRSKKMFSVMKIRAKFLEAAREWFKEHGYTEFTPPMFTKAACEGGSTLFPVEYFGDTVYLPQSWQLYGEAAISSLGKIFTISPSFRAEKSRTRKHLTEFLHLEVEMPFFDMEDLMKMEEEFLTFVLHKVAKDMEKELKQLDRDPKDLLKIKPPFPRLSYDEAVEILKKEGLDVKWGDDFGADEERALTKNFDTPIFVMRYPKEAKAFYHKPDSKRPEVTLSVDMLAPEGIGEITGGGQRIHDPEELIQRIKEEKLDVKDYEWYLDIRKWGTVPHSGFGLGVERVIMWICKLKHIRDAVPFPRLINRVYP
jgi:asparaginyl-tRNA synthetase